ncbi:MAG: NHL repeat-containing protein [Thermoanaerobaculia bacterium]
MRFPLAVSGRGRHLAVVLLSSATVLLSCKKSVEQPGAPTTGPAKSPEMVSKPAGSVAATVTMKIVGGGLKNPRSVAVDPSGNLYVADTGNSRIVKFDATGRQLAAFGKKGKGPGEFGEAWIAAVSPQRNILVLDRETTWIQVFSPDGKFVTQIAGPQATLYFPGGMAVGPDGVIAIADTGGNRVVFLEPDGKLHSKALTGAGGIALVQPSDVFFGPKGDFFIYQTASSGGKARLFHLQGGGATLAAWEAVEAPSTRDGPRGLVLPNGRILLTDPREGRLLLLAADGETYQTVRLGGGQALKFDGGVAMDSRNGLYVVEIENSALYRFELEAEGAKGK